MALLLPLLLLLSFLFVATVAYLSWHFLFQLPTPQPSAEQIFLTGKTVWITGASSGIGKGQGGQGGNRS